MTATITELLDFHARKGTPDDYAPSVNLGELKALVAERDTLLERRHHAKRNADILQQHLAGNTARTIGRAHNLSMARIGQILAKARAHGLATLREPVVLTRGDPDPPAAEDYPGPPMLPDEYRRAVAYAEDDPDVLLRGCHLGIGGLPPGMPIPVDVLRTEP